ncbi:DUF1822 family protein [bacterium]|nr:DUF1822 family protein [bacterium]
MWVEVCPAESQLCLPENMHLAVLDEEEETVMQTRARGTQKIQLQFRGEAGEMFHIKVAMGEYSFTETFLI